MHEEYILAAITFKLPKNKNNKQQKTTSSTIAVSAPSFETAAADADAAWTDVDEDEPTVAATGSIEISLGVILISCVEESSASFCKAMLLMNFNKLLRHVLHMEIRNSVKVS